MIITGCQRSGTKTAATIFGITHEKLFHPLITIDSVSQLQPPILDSSWLAAPFAHFINKEMNIPVIHLIRHPLSVINSLIGIQFFNEDIEGHKPYRLFIERHLKGIEVIKNPISKAMFYWLYWNKLVEFAPRIKIESIGNAPKLNKRQRANLTWNDLPTGALKALVEDKTKEYGYLYE